MSAPIAWEVMASYAEGMGVRFCTEKSLRKRPRVTVDLEDALFVLRDDLTRRAQGLLRQMAGDTLPAERLAVADDADPQDTALWSCALIGALTEMVLERAGVHLDSRARAAAQAAEGMTGKARYRAIRAFLRTRPAIVVALTPRDMAALSVEARGTGVVPDRPSRVVRIMTSVGPVAVHPGSQGS